MTLSLHICPYFNEDCPTCVKKQSDMRSPLRQEIKKLFDERFIHTMLCGSRRFVSGRDMSCDCGLDEHRTFILSEVITMVRKEMVERTEKLRKRSIPKVDSLGRRYNEMSLKNHEYNEAIKYILASISDNKPQ